MCVCASCIVLLCHLWEPSAAAVLSCPAVSCTHTHTHTLSQILKYTHTRTHSLSIPQIYTHTSYAYTDSHTVDTRHPIPVFSNCVCVGGVCVLALNSERREESG